MLGKRKREHKKDRLSHKHLLSPQMTIYNKSCKNIALNNRPSGNYPQPLTTQQAWIAYLKDITQHAITYFRSNVVSPPSNVLMRAAALANPDHMRSSGLLVTSRELAAFGTCPSS